MGRDTFREIRLLKALSNDKFNSEIGFYVSFLDAKPVAVNSC